MKKGLGISALFLSMINFVSAQTLLGDATRSLADFIKSLLDGLYLNPDYSSKLLLGALLWIILYSIIVKVFKQDGKIIPTAMSLIMVVLSFIYIPNNFIQAIVLQYSAMGATILSVIPLIILLYFSISITSSLFVARITWVFYSFYYFSLFIYKIATLPTGTPWVEYIPYLAATIAGIVIIFVLPGIRGLLFKGELGEIEEQGMRYTQRKKLLKQLNKEELESYKE